MKGPVHQEISQQTEEILRYIEEHLNEPITLKTLSEQFFFSSYYFHRVFKRAAGKSLAVYVRERRVSLACRLLSETNASAAEIGMQCGFQTPQSFTRTFKRMTGLTPSEYRKSIQSHDIT